VDAAEGPLSASSLMIEGLMACGRRLTIRQGKEHNAAWAAICVSPKNMRRYSKRTAVVEAEGRPPLQARDHMATVFTPPLTIRAHQRAMD
jgi:hypothetical protein